MDPTPEPDDSPRPSRRSFMRLLAGAGLLPLLPLAGPPARGALRATGASRWATGGTAAMVARDTYPAPFPTPPSSLHRIQPTTEGPCTTLLNLERQDVSEGWDGLPVRLALKLVDVRGRAYPGVRVKIWHTNREGSYSGQTPNNRMCLQRPAYAATDFFRGVQVTDDAGEVAFDTCFPGWYRGRAVHIHFQVSAGPTTYRVSQLFFPPEVTREVFAAHEAYREFGQPDTPLDRDGIAGEIPAVRLEDHVLEVARLADGAMLASKVIALG